ncbi:MAG: hypothetical protein H6711_16010 [Myxococcales bacterium]|nr:hypothetical protein [Myxococcales bacterium]
MILVTGSKRSGTSMWMQILAAAGLPVIGERFPASWEALIGDQNPDGFYESQLSAGIYHRTNPHPLTGAYLFPEQTRRHAVKVFVPGLVRSDVAFIDRVIATVRGWRAQSASLLRLRAALGEDRGIDPSLLLPPAYEWWADTFALIRDVATRRYPLHMISYEALVADPAREIAAVLGWIGEGDLEAASAAVRGRPPAAAAPNHDDDARALAGDLDPGLLALFDELHDHIHRQRPLSAALVDRLNQADAALRPRLLAHNAGIRQAAVDRLLADARG